MASSRRSAPLVISSTPTGSEQRNPSSFPSAVAASPGGSVSKVTTSGILDHEVDLGTRKVERSAEVFLHRAARARTHALAREVSRLLRGGALWDEEHVRGGVVRLRHVEAVHPTVRRSPPSRRRDPSGRPSCLLSPRSRTASRSRARRPAPGHELARVRVVPCDLRRRELVRCALRVGGALRSVDGEGLGRVLRVGEEDEGAPVQDLGELVRRRIAARRAVRAAAGTSERAQTKAATRVSGSRRPRFT